ncbi:MAG TPA: ATP-binding protein [Thermoanaerobaculia bacterium]|jgi:nitrogen fixation/metabolism regulation signal transduction histidine kinase|nr:ATP-binding protein [Thermoanaerobaculia bacterium]
MASDLEGRRTQEREARPARRFPFGGLLRGRRALAFEDRVLLLAVATGLPGSCIALLLVWLDPHSLKLRWTITLLVAFLWAWLAANLRDRVVRPLQTLANLLSALREGDFSLRARQPQESDALAQVVHEVNAIGEVLREQRLGAVEAAALLHRVVNEVDVAVFAFDELGQLRLVNRAGERLLTEPADHLLGRAAEELGLADLLGGGEIPRLQSLTFPGGPGRWEIRRSTFRELGRPHRLLVISDLSQSLREEERQAWQRLIRVLGHELNNSLAPIHSMASTLANLLTREPPPEDWKEDMQRGLEVIGDRSGALIRFMAAYARLARLPPPRRAPFELSSLIRRTAALETRLPVYVERGPEVTLEGDADQIEQLLINLLRNAVDAALLTGGGVGVGWRANGAHVEVRVEDEGPGLSNTENLFVPFYTTKPGGTGIGLALSRQIAEAHGGTLTLANRSPEPGCKASLRLPL